MGEGRRRGSLYRLLAAQQVTVSQGICGKHPYNYVFLPGRPRF